MEYKRGLMAIAVSVLAITAIVSSVVAVAGEAEMNVPESATVKGGDRAKLSITVTNPCDSDVDNIMIWVDGSPDLLENWIAGSDAREKLLLAADNLDNSGPWFSWAGDNLALAADNKASAGPDLVEAGDALQTSLDDWYDDALSAGGDADAAENVYLLVRSAGDGLRSAGQAMDDEPENLDLIASYLENAATNLDWAAGDETYNPPLDNTGVNLDNWAHDAADNLESAADDLSAAASELRGGRIGAAASSLLEAAENIEAVADNLTDPDLQAAFRNAGTALESAAGKLEDAHGFLLKAATAIGTAENYLMSVGRYIDAVENLDPAGSYIENAALLLENAENALINDDNILAAGENIWAAADNLEAAAGYIGSALGGDELGAVAADLKAAADNLKGSEQVNLAVAGQKLKDAVADIAAAADKMATEAAGMAPATWQMGASDVDWIRFSGIEENVISPGESETFTFFVDVANRGGEYTLRIRYFEVGSSTWDAEDTLTLTVDNTLPELEIEVTQAGVGIPNLINKGPATLTITASEPLSSISDVVIENEDVFLTIPSDNLVTTDNIVFTYEFTAGAWDDNSPVKVTVASATDLVGNKGEGFSGSFTVDTSPPIFLENGLTTLLSTMVQKTRADGTTFLYVDNDTLTREFSGGVVDNREGENIQGYGNVTVTVEVNGVVYSTEYNAPDNENEFFVLGQIELREGLNTVIVTATDLTGNFVSDNVENIFIDCTPPWVSFDTITSDAFGVLTWDENEELTNDPTPTISLTIHDVGLGVAYDPGGADYYDNQYLWVWLDNDENYQNGIIDNLENATPYLWRVEPDEKTGSATFENTFDNAGSGLVDGTYFIGVKVADNIDHNGENRWIFYRSFTVDTTPPGAPVISDNVGGTRVSPGLTIRSPTVTLVGTGDPGATVKVYVNGTEQPAARTTVSSAGEWITDVVLLFGVNKIEVSLTDAAGNESDKALYGYVLSDVLPPTVRITSPADGTTTTDETVLVQFKVSDDWTDPVDLRVGLSSPEYSIPEGELSVETDGTRSIQVPLCLGTNLITVTARDEAGNVGAASITVIREPVPTDTTPPTISVTAPESTTEVLVTVSGTVTDDVSDPESISVSVTGTGLAAPMAVSLASDGSFSVTVPLVEGQNTISVTAVDEAGNSGTKSVTVTRLMDTTKPTVSITAPADGTSTSDASVVVKGKVSDDWTEAADLSVSVNAPGLPSPLNVAPAADGSFSVTVPLVEGQNTISVTAVDEAGNDFTATVTVKRTVTPWAMYAAIIAIIFVILAAIAILRR